MFLRNGHGLRIKQAGIGHLDGGTQSVIMGDLLLGTEYIQRLLQDGIAGQILDLALLRLLLDVFRHHLRTMDDCDIEVAHGDSYL